MVWYKNSRSWMSVSSIYCLLFCWRSRKNAECYERLWKWFVRFPMESFNLAAMKICICPSVFIKSGQGSDFNLELGTFHAYEIFVRHVSFWWPLIQINVVTLSRWGVRLSWRYPIMAWNRKVFTVRKSQKTIDSNDEYSDY